MTLFTSNSYLKLTDLFWNITVFPGSSTYPYGCLNDLKVYTIWLLA